ncbi:MAG: hypothetical protein WC897_02385 [Candidatus Gracilibacteria bacterium]
MQTSFKKPATTLIEIILYFAILAIFLAVAMSFALQISNISTLSGNMHELEYSAGELANQLTESIQKADSVNTGGSIFDNPSGVLSLNMDDAGVSPTVFSLSGGDIYFKEGLGESLKLNTPFVTITELTFHHITSYKNPDQISVDAIFKTVNSDLANLDHQIPVHITISLRSF